MDCRLLGVASNGMSLAMLYLPLADSKAEEQGNWDTATAVHARCFQVPHSHLRMQLWSSTPDQTVIDAADQQGHKQRCYGKR